MPSTVFNPATGEQKGRRIGEASWTAARDAATSSTNSSQPGCQSNSTGAFDNYRGFEPFDTSTLPDDATVTAVTLELYRDDASEDGGNGFDNGDTTSAVVVASTQADPTAYANTDYNEAAFTSKGSTAFASTTNGAYFTITITDTSIISLSGYTKLAVITELDRANTQPTGENRLTWQSRAQANPPKLTVTYSQPEVGGNRGYSFTI